MGTSTNTSTQTTVIPVAVEDVALETVSRDVERVRAKTSVTVEDARVDATCERERIEIERVPVGRPVDRAPPVRVEGDTTIISVVEEVLVVEKRLVLTEEVRLTKRRSVEPRELHVPVRREHVEIERDRVDPGGGEGREDKEEIP